MIGWIGLGLLLVSYLMLVTKWSKYFLVTDCIASIVLTIHAITIADLPFTIVNGFISIMLFIKIRQGGLK